MVPADRDPANVPPTELPEEDEVEDLGPEEEAYDRDDRGARERRRRLGDAIVSGILESGAAIRRGQDLIGGVASGTKEEIVRIVGAEVRGFLDKMDVVDLAQEVVSGLVVEVKTEIRFRRDDQGKVRPVVDEEKTKTKISNDEVS